MGLGDLRGKEAVGAELGADRVVVTMAAARGAVLALDHGSTEAVRPIQERNQHTLQEQERSQQCGGGASHSTRMM